MRVRKKILQIVSIGISMFFKTHGKTICPFVWDTVFIDETGDVFVCCHRPLWRVGNVYKKDLQDIWTRSFRLKLLRFVSRFGGLRCMSKCTLLTRKEKTRYRAYNKIAYPKRIHVQYSTACNMHCIMCRQDSDSRVMLADAVLKKRVQWELAEELILQGGEIFALESAKQLYAWLVTEKKVKVNIITNGTMIDESWHDILVIGSRWIEISVNAATSETYAKVACQPSFDHVIQTIRGLVKRRQEIHADAAIFFHFTIVPENVHETAQAIYFAQELGCDRIVYSFDKSMYAYLRAHPEAKSAIRAELQHMSEDMSVTIAVRALHLDYLGVMPTGCAGFDVDTMLDHAWIQ